MRKAFALAVAALLTVTMYWLLAKLVTADEDAVGRVAYLVSDTPAPPQLTDYSGTTSRRTRDVPILEEPYYASPQQFISFWGWDPIPFDHSEFASELERPTDRPSWPPGDYQLQDQPGRLAANE